MLRLRRLALASLALLSAALPLPAAESPHAAAFESWRADRFGLFIHWGPVSLKGTEIGWSRAGERRGYRYFSFDNDAARSAARQDPAGFVAGLPEKLYIESYGNFVRMADVFVDSRGDIYLTGGAQQGIYILRYTGPVKN